MKPYLISLCFGLLAGLIYSFLQVKSPAPPVIALLGLLGLLIGEQIVPIMRHWLARQPLTATWFREECIPKITGVAAKEGAPVHPKE